MSSQIDAENSTEQPFQLVQKRSSSQGRSWKGMTRERASHSKPQGHTEETSSSSRNNSTSSKRPHHQKPDKEPRVRSQSGGVPVSRSSSSSQRQDQTRGKEGNSLRLTRENSWENELKQSPTEKPNRFERLSLSSETTTSNRFEGLDPDSEAPSDLSPDNFTERKRSAKRSKSPSRKSSSSSDVGEWERRETKELDVFESVFEGSEFTEEREAITSSNELQDTSSESKKTEKDSTSRIRYSRDELIELKSSQQSLKRPAELKEEYYRYGKWCAEAWLTPQCQEEGEVVDEGKSRHPAALALIREHDVKQYPKVCLSPQRRSFGSGCSWKETPSGNAPSATPPSSNPSDFLSGERDDLFFEMEGSHPPPAPVPRTAHPPPNFTPQFQAPPPPSPHSHLSPPSHTHTPRVIDHIPLRDRERKNWREKDPSWRHKKPIHEELEPEWMAFGPSDRSEVIELKGLDEHEREREVRRETDGLQDISPIESITPQSGGSGEGEPLSPRVLSDGSVGAEVGVGRGEEEMDNEFILDGFDFSTGVSICHELASEDADDSAKAPDNLSSDLMKALGVGDKHQENNHVLSMGRHPANALTLDEIQARENIHSAPQPHRDYQDQSAFNKLVAQLQGATSTQEQKPPTPTQLPPEKLPRPIPLPPKKQPTIPRQFPQPLPLPPDNFPLPIGPPPERKNNFGYLLEKELNFDEDELLLPFPPTREPLSRLDPYGIPLQNLKRTHGHLPVPAGLPDNWMDVYPEMVDPLDPLWPPSPRQLASARQQQQQMMAGRPGSNHWAVEMERRRQLELQQMEYQQMRHRERMMNPNMVPPMGRHKPPPPNISLLPTAVMRHLHNTKPNQPLLEMTRPSQSSSVMANRLDQDLTSKASETQSTIANLLNHSDMNLDARDYHLPPLGYGMMGPPPNNPRHISDPALYPPPHFLQPMPHGMPQNPYMH